MTRLVMIPLVALLCAPLTAGEAEQANAQKFLEGQTALNDAAKGESTLKLRMLGVSVGKFTIKVEHGEYDGTKCYVVTAAGEFELGGVKSKLSANSRIAHNLHILHETSTEHENDELVKSIEYTDANGVLKVKLFNKKADHEADREVESEIKPEPRMLLGMAHMLAQVLIPAEAGRKYEFVDWHIEAARSFVLTLEAAGAEDVAGGKARKVVTHGSDFERGEEGKWEESSKSESVWLSGPSFVRVKFKDGTLLDSGPDPKRTPISKEALAKQDKELHPAILFFDAIGAKDEELLKKAVNMDRFIDFVIENNEELKDLEPEDKAAVKEYLKPEMAKNFFNDEKEKTDVEKKREAAVMQLLKHEENFEVIKIEEYTAVVFTGEAKDMFGNMAFYVEKNKEGAWQVIWVGERPAEKKKPEEKKPGKEKEEEEEY